MSCPPEQKTSELSAQWVDTNSDNTTRFHLHQTNELIERATRCKPTLLLSPRQHPPPHLEGLRQIQQESVSDCHRGCQQLALHGRVHCIVALRTGRSPPHVALHHGEAVDCPGMAAGPVTGRACTLHMQWIISIT